MTRLLGLLCAPALLASEFQMEFHEDARRWILTNSAMEVTVRMGLAGTFEMEDLVHRPTGQRWTAASGSSPIRLRVGERWIDRDSRFTLVRHWTEETARGGLRLNIELAEATGLGTVTAGLEIYPNLPVARTSVRYRNTTGLAVDITDASPVTWSFDDGGQRFQIVRVEQWMPSLGANPANFERQIAALDPGGRAVPVRTGAHGTHCAWVAVHDTGQSRGLAFGWEFNGRATVTVSHTQGELRLSSTIPEIHHAVPAGGEFQTPRSFVGLYRGGPDDASFVTQRFAESILAKPLPDGAKFPFVSWDSWGYGQEINETILRREAELAARSGVELFVVDLGWSRAIGDWRPDPVKFPSGLRALSDYVHSLGMQFGLHFAMLDAAAGSEVLRDHPDWRSSVNNNYYGADSLCPAHRPVREWIAAEAVRMIDEYGVDWLLQDGENMVKECRRTDHTHHPGDSNYANAVDGLGWILAEVQRQRPNVAWENCENGGNLMTFEMVQQYVTSIVNDASGALGSRVAVFGATIPFPPRYTDRYMPEMKMDAYTTRSYMFGGPWILMNRLTEMERPDLDFLTAEIERYKQLRGLVRDAKVLHLTAPGEGRNDAIAAYDGDSDSAVAIVTRDGAAAASYSLRIPEFDPGASYLVRFASDSRTLTLTGSRIAAGFAVRLPESRDSEIVYITPLR